ncbi:MAG: hypothetical protein KDK40_05625, partial [Chlamydiia bacterium]|nr:hypothetical protein [Chlamydiia bacterium]
VAVSTFNGFTPLLERMNHRKISDSENWWHFGLNSGKNTFYEVECYRNSEIKLQKNKNRKSTPSDDEFNKFLKPEWNTMHPELFMDKLQNCLGFSKGMYKVCDDAFYYGDVLQENMRYFPLRSRQHGIRKVMGDSADPIRFCIFTESLRRSRDDT